MPDEKGGGCRPTPASHKPGGVCAARARPSRFGGAGAETSSTRPVLAGLISRLPSLFNGELLSPHAPALDLGPLATNAAARLTPGRDPAPPAR